MAYSRQSQCSSLGRPIMPRSLLIAFLFLYLMLWIKAATALAASQASKHHLSIHEICLEVHVELLAAESSQQDMQLPQD